MVPLNRDGIDRRCGDAKFSRLWDDLRVRKKSSHHEKKRKGRSPNEARRNLDVAQRQTQAVVLSAEHADDHPPQGRHVPGQRAAHLKHQRVSRHPGHRPHNRTRPSRLARFADCA
jgi:hypothetical protein